MPGMMPTQVPMTEERIRFHHCSFQSRRLIHMLPAVVFTVSTLRSTSIRSDSTCATA